MAVLHASAVAPPKLVSGLLQSRISAAIKQPSVDGRKVVLSSIRGRSRSFNLPNLKSSTQNITSHFGNHTLNKENRRS